jgi:hypothetical protein
MESFLKEQLKRIQNLAEQVSSLERRAAEMTSGRTKEPAISHGPLADVKDLRPYRSVDVPESSDAPVTVRKASWSRKRRHR